MTIAEAIAEADALRPNEFSVKKKIRWLSRVDSMVKIIIDRHEGAEPYKFSGYGSDTDQDTVLLMPEPYDEAYTRYLEAMMAYEQEEMDSYNSALELFNARYRDYSDDYTRKHMPLSVTPRYF